MLTFWILQTGEPLHIDAGNPRPMRAMNLANSLVKAGHNVVLWSSSFYHQEKRHRSSDNQYIRVSSSLEIRLISSPGYERNIGLRRLWDHVVFAHNLKKALRAEKYLPNAAFIGYPPIESADALVKYLSDRNIPCMLDLKDQWPSLFLEVLPVWVRFLGKVILFPYFYVAKRAMSRATGLSAMADSFLKWGLDFADRNMSKHDKVFPLTSPIGVIESEKFELGKVWWDAKNVLEDSSIFRVIFIGSHMSVFDFEPIRDAANLFLTRGVECQFVICGDGGFSEQLRSMMAGLPNVIFSGWIDRSQIEVLAQRSHAALIPYKNIDNFTKNIPNKVIDALSLGLPVLSPLEGEVANLISEYGVGLRYGPDSGKTLAECILIMLENSSQREQMSKNAKNLYHIKFSFDMVYGDLVRHMECLAQKHID